MVSRFPRWIPVAALFLAACSGESRTADALTGISSTALAKAPAAPAFYTGRWSQNPAIHTVLLTGEAQDVWAEIFITQDGTKISGTARRYLNSFDANGAPVLVGYDLGSPGRVTGSVTATGLSLNIRGLGEANQNVSYTFTLSPDGTRLINAHPVAFSIASFVR